MRILFLTQYYPPEPGAAQIRLSDLAQRLAASGHEVHVLTAMPSYPKGEVFGDYRGKLSMRERLHGVLVSRVWCYTSIKRGFASRLLNYCSFSLVSLFYGLLKAPRADVIIVESPPLFLGLTGVVLKKATKARMVLNVSDLWTESAIAMGVLRNPWLIRRAMKMQAFIYRHADLLTGQTNGIVRDLESQVTEAPVALLTNGVDPDFFGGSSSIDRQRVREELGFGDRLTVGYTGLHGLAQGLDTLVDAATILRDNSQIAFAFFGDGPEKTRLERIVRERRLLNVRFYGPRPRSRMLEVLTALDVAAVPLKRLDIFKGALPCKMFESMAGGLPLVLAIEGEAKELVTRANAGICVQPENPQQVADAILCLYNDPELRARLGGHGRSFVMKNYNRVEIAREFENLLCKLTHTREAALVSADAV